jgi:positive regulator of sigma E activity
MRSFQRTGKVLSEAKGVVKVSLPAAGACGSCSAKTICGEASGRIIEIENKKLAPGQSCQIQVPESQGLWSALLAFGIPTVFLFMGVFLSKAFALSEGYIALFGLVGVLLGLLILNILNPLWKKWFPLVIKPDPQQNLALESLEEQAESQGADRR